MGGAQLVAQAVLVGQAGREIEERLVLEFFLGAGDGDDVIGDEQGDDDDQIAGVPAPFPSGKSNRGVERYRSPWLARTATIIFPAFSGRAATA